VILGKWPTWRTILFYVFISIFYMFRKELSDLHTKRSSTQSDIYQVLYWCIWFSWWWARGCSKHVENWNKYIEKNCASSWSFTKNHNKMHGQQNIYIFFKELCYFILHSKPTLRTWSPFPWNTEYRKTPYTCLYRILSFPILIIIRKLQKSNMQYNIMKLSGD